MYKRAVCGFATWQHALTCVVGEFPDLLNLPHVLEITDHWIDSKSGELSCSCLVFFIRFGSFSSCLRLLIQDCRNVLRGGDGGWLTFVLTIFEIAARTESIQYLHYLSVSAKQFVVSVHVKMKAVLICTKRTNTWTHSHLVTLHQTMQARPSQNRLIQNTGG